MDTRDQLIDSTRELLWERGYVGTSPKAIQQRAGAGQGSMYHHFAGKKELALAATIVAVLQGGYVLARAAGSPEPFDQAVSGVLALLAAH